MVVIILLKFKLFHHYYATAMSSSNLSHISILEIDLVLNICPRTFITIDASSFAVTLATVYLGKFRFFNLLLKAFMSGFSGDDDFGSCLLGQVWPYLRFKVVLEEHWRAEDIQTV